MSASVQVYRLRVIPASGTPDLPPSVEALFHQPFTQKELLCMLPLLQGPSLARTV